MSEVYGKLLRDATRIDSSHVSPALLEEVERAVLTSQASCFRFWAEDAHWEKRSLGILKETARALNGLARAVGRDVTVEIDESQREVHVHDPQQENPDQ